MGAFTATAYGLSTPRGDDWRKRALCRPASGFDVDPDDFHPMSESKAVNQEAVERAKAACAACDVWRECLLFGLQTGDAWAIYGGYTATERRREFGGRPDWPQPEQQPPVRCGRGRHWMTAENIYVDPKRGARQCCACRAEGARNRERRREQQALAVTA